MNAVELKKEQEDIEWYRLHESEELSYLQQINDYLREGTNESKEKICSLMERREILDAFETRNEMSYIINAVNIYYREIDAGVKHTIFDVVACVNELIQIMNQVRFYVWELEFTNDEETGDLLCNFIEENNMSVQMLLYLMETAVLDRHLVTIKLSEIFKKKHMLKYELHALLLAINTYESDETILRRLAEIYTQAGRDDLAKNCLQKLKMQEV